MDREKLYEQCINEIKNRMDELKISQKELSEMVGISEAAISRYLNGSRIMKGDILLATIYTLCK